MGDVQPQDYSDNDNLYLGVTSEDNILDLEVENAIQSAKLMILL